MMWDTYCERTHGGLVQGSLKVRKWNSLAVSAWTKNTVCGYVSWDEKSDFDNVIQTSADYQTPPLKFPEKEGRSRGCGFSEHFLPLHVSVCWHSLMGQCHLFSQCSQKCLRELLSGGWHLSDSCLIPSLIYTKSQLWPQWAMFLI